jgi:c-di-GMP-binding flagellar brake protein YcgR
MSSPEDRRQYPRVSLTHVTVEVYDAAGQPDKPEFCFIINVSENGMLFKTDQKSQNYGLNKRVRLTFVLPDDAIIIRTDAIIIHSHQTELAQYIGVQFRNLGASEHQSLQDFISKSLQKTTS